MKILAIANHKGGVGKTATAHALGSSLAALGCHVLLVDCDPQAALSYACGVNSSLDMAQVFCEKAKIAEVIAPVSPGLDIAPSSLDMAHSELQLVSRWGREYVLRNQLKNLSYDLAILDCPPNLGLLTVNALVAADAVLIPTQPHEQDLHALESFASSVTELRALNSDLAVFGILVTCYIATTILHREVVQAMRDAGWPLLDMVVRRSVSVAECVAEKKAITDYAPRSQPAQAYRQLAAEVQSWLEK